MGFTYPPIIGDSTLYNPRFYPSIGADGVLTFDFAQTLYLSKNDFRLSYLSGVIPGSATSGSALVLGETLSLSGLGSVSCSALTVGGVAVGTLPSFLDGISPGTAANNKALVLDGSGAIAMITSMSTTNIYGSVKTGSQTGITAVGALSGLTIDGNLSFTGASRTITGLSSISATTLTGALSSAAQPAITSIGTLSALTIGGNLTFTGASRTLTGLSSISATTLTGTLYTAAQTAITSLGTLSALTVSGISSVGSVQISGTEVITNTRQIQNIGDITCSGAINAFSGYQLNGATLVDSIQNVFAASVISIYAQLDKAAGTVYSSTLKTNEYNLALSNSSNVSATFAGLAFHIDTAPLSGATPGACIISERNSTTAYDGSSISFCKKGTAGFG
jgi:hypothetical protein